MNPSLRRFRPLAVAALCAMIAPAAFAVTATTDPVGFVKVDYQGNSDSYSSIPFKRTPEYAGSLASVSGNQLTASGTPNFGNLVYAAGTQPKTYYVLFTSGPKLGLFYTITANTATTVTVDPLGDDISGVAAATFQVIPYDTLGTLFPGGQGVVGSAAHGLAVRKTEILIPDHTTAGANLAATAPYYYYTGIAGAGPGWRRQGATGTIVNDGVLYPDSTFIVRQNDGTASNTTFMGTVHMKSLAATIGTIDANTKQDNAVALPIPAELNLTQSNLFESGAFVGSTAHGLAVRKDELLVWDNAVAGKNKAADRIYYYYTGVAGVGPGWRLQGASGTVANTDIVIAPNGGIVIRKAATPAPGTVTWTVLPPYGN